MWLQKYLHRLGKLEEDLAAELFENNWTAIAEARSLPFLIGRVLSN